jgi:hypothetical protein
MMQLLENIHSLIDWYVPLVVIVTKLIASQKVLYNNIVTMCVCVCVCVSSLRFNIFKSQI